MARISPLACSRHDLSAAQLNGDLGMNKITMDSRDRSCLRPHFSWGFRPRQVLKTHLGFRVEEIDDRDPQQVETGKQEVCSVLKMIKHDGIDQNGPADSDRPAGDTEAVSLGTKVAGKYLGRDQESDRTPRCRLTEGLLELRQVGNGETHVDQVEQEEHCHCGGSDRGSLGRVLARSLVESSSYGVDDAEAHGTDHHAASTTPAIHDLGGDDGPDDTDRVETTGKTVLLERGITGLR
jgi:hypothetical protein